MKTLIILKKIKIAMGADIYFQWISEIIKLSSGGGERERALLKILLGLLKASIKRIRN